MAPWTRAVLAATLAIGLLPPADPAGASDAQPACEEVAWTATWLSSADPLTPLTDGTVTLLGSTAPVDLSALGPTSNPFPDASARLWFWSMHWLAAAARAAAVAQRDDLLVRAVAAAVGFHAADPDPGGADPRLAAAVGWDEGAVTRRTEAMNCLFHTALAAGLPQAEQLRGVLGMLAAASLDPDRYYGPPRRRPHNHGLLANHALWTAGALLGRPDLVAAARSRMVHDLATSFTPAGVSIEGSSVYHFVVLDLWRRAAERVALAGDVAAAQAMQSVVDSAATTAAHLLHPDGSVNLIGDGVADATTARGAAAPPGPLLSDPASLVAARFSWTDSTTPYLTMRVGSTAGAHGHQDFGSITWDAGGRPIIVDAGFYDYEATALNARLESAEAHNGPRIARREQPRRPRLSARLRSAAVEGSVGHAAATVRWGPRRRWHVVREATFTSAGSLTVADRGRHLRRQAFLFHPEYSTAVVAPDSRSALVTSGAGASVRVTTSKGARITWVRGGALPRGGWVAPTWRTVVPAIRLTVKGRQEVETTFTAGAGSAVTTGP